MLRPNTLAPADYGVALRPIQGYAEQLSVSLEASTELGLLEIVALNSGIFTPNSGEQLHLADKPQELLAMLETRTVMGPPGATIVLTVTGTYADGLAMTGTATFIVPPYAKDQSANLAPCYSAEVVRSDLTKKVKSVTSVIPTTAGASAIGTKISIFGVPSLETYTVVPCRDSMDWNPRVQMPHPIRCGNDPYAFVLPGDKSEGALNITAKLPSEVDGLMRINGQRVTGLIRMTKEGVLEVQRVFLLGLIVTVKRTAPEGQEASTVTGTGMYEDSPILPAL